MSLLAQIKDIGVDIGLARQVGQLLFPREYKLVTDDAVEFKIDTVLEESHESTISITNYAVEQGADMADHYVVNPAVFNMTCLISDITTNEFIDFGLGGIAGQAVGQTVTGTRSQLAYDDLKSIQQSGAFISYESNLELYENMLISNLRVNQDKSTSKAIFFSLTLTEVFIAESETVAGQGIFSLPNSDKGNPSTKDKMASVTQKGKKKATEATDKASSALFKVFG